VTDINTEATAEPMSPEAKQSKADFKARIADINAQLRMLKRLAVRAKADGGEKKTRKPRQKKATTTGK
jgi:hypothetical protein